MFEKTRTRVRVLYEEELADARKLLDDTSMANTKLEMDLKNQKAKTRDLLSAAKEKEEKSSKLERAVQGLESQLAEVRKKSEDILNDRNRNADELKTTISGNKKLASKLIDSKKNLEEETLKKIVLENKVLTMKEEHRFSISVLEQQLDSLQEMRDVYELQKEENKAKG